MGKLRKVVALFCAGLLISSCAPSYPQEKVADALVRLCREEYKLDVKAQVVDKTLGVQVIIPGLIDELLKNAPSEGMNPPPLLVEGQYEQKKFDFQFLTRGSFARVEKQPDITKGKKKERDSEPLKSMDHVSTALQRVILSTNAPLEFYTLIARDPGPAGLDVVFSGHIYDLKQAQYMAISRGEMQRRSEVGLRHQPEQVARETVVGFLHDLSKRSLPSLLSRYAANSKRFGELLPKIIDVAVTVQGEGDELLSDQWPIRQINPNEVLVYVALAPIRKQGAVLFHVSVGEGQGSLLDVERFETNALPSRYRSLGPVEKWKNALYVEPMTMPKFLADQISKRVLSEFQPIKTDSKDSKNKNKAKNRKPANNDEVARVVMESAAYLFNSYRYNKFDQVTITDATTGTKWVVPSKDISTYRRRNAPLQPVP